MHCMFSRLCARSLSGLHTTIHPYLRYPFRLRLLDLFQHEGLYACVGVHHASYLTCWTYQLLQFRLTSLLKLVWSFFINYLRIETEKKSSITFHYSAVDSVGAESASWSTEVYLHFLFLLVKSLAEFFALKKYVGCTFTLKGSWGIVKHFYSIDLRMHLN